MIREAWIKSLSDSDEMFSNPPTLSHGRVILDFDQSKEHFKALFLYFYENKTITLLPFSSIKSLQSCNVDVFVERLSQRTTYRIALMLRTDNDHQLHLTNGAKVYLELSSNLARRQ